MTRHCAPTPLLLGRTRKTWAEGDDTGGAVVIQNSLSEYIIYFIRKLPLDQIKANLNLQFEWIQQRKEMIQEEQ